MTPLQLFREWIADVDPPVAMALATASADGAPSVRMVLLKEAGDNGVVKIRERLREPTGSPVAR